MKNWPTHVKARATAQGRFIQPTAALLLLSVGCRPDLGPRDGLVTSPAILAVKAEPPEARPGIAAMYTALAASSVASGSGAPPFWRFCTAPKPLADDNVVSVACLQSALLVPAGSGLSVMATAPSNGCSVFGPATASAGARPQDPDGTGGYYQPLRVDWESADPTFFLVRILCGLADAPGDIVTRYAQQYVPNANPHLLPLAPTLGGAPVSLSSIPVGSRVQIDAAWGAADAETYAYFDPASQTLTTKREAMQVAWYTSDGFFDTESTGRDESDPMTTTINTWTAPGKPVSGHLWVVLRDSRGGVDFGSYDIGVIP